MKYLVMECNLSHAIVLDEDGRFIKVANLNYQVGQTVTDIIEMKTPEVQQINKKMYAWFSTAAAIVACLILTLTLYSNYYAPYASVLLTINPEVRIDVNRKNQVIDIEGMNDDGKELITDYIYKKKVLDLVIDDLIDRAIILGYLSDGDTVSLSFDANDEEWIVDTENTTVEHLKEHINTESSISIEINSNNIEINTTTSDKNNQTQITIPVTTKQPETNAGYSETDYGNDDDIDDVVDDVVDDDDDIDNIDDDIDDVDDFEVSPYQAHKPDDSGYTDYSPTKAPVNTPVANKSNYDDGASGYDDYNNESLNYDDDGTSDYDEDDDE